jgi:hypothetical protein
LPFLLCCSGKILAGKEDEGVVLALLVLLRARIVLYETKNLQRRDCTELETASVHNCKINPSKRTLNIKIISNGELQKLGADFPVTNA